ncbi:hypothetical protein [Cecembia calidifontis]|jgi:hypothetical protein|uniref:Outer membrane protein with beta-barrel domain n=1 Tax=Cecembia calidifontis TaxID=1187080 RepID=A0A4Q7PE01_9BACT|nr:hypothetical protein [Cecembia calidifontis]RZS98337.1 hypothetical protein BC751_3983 [Cecembia calidifontis]
MKFKTFVLVVLPCFFILSVYGQQDSKRWEVGIDALSLFSKNQLPSYSIFGRYQLNPNAEKESFIRARVGYQIQNFEKKTPDEFYTLVDDKAANTLFSLGYQKDFVSSAKHSMYYGGDLNFIRRIQTISAFYFSEETLMLYTTDRTNFSMNINVLMGFSYKPISQIKVSFESGLFAGRTYKNEDYLAETQEGDAISWGSVSSNKIDFGVLPFYQILFTINF